MREEVRRQLDRKLRIERLKKVGAGLAVAAVAAVGMWFSGLDASVDIHKVAGVIEAVGPIVGANSRDTERGLAVDIRLDGGRHVHVTTLKETDPHVGDRVEIAEHVHGTGRVTYSWR